MIEIDLDTQYILNDYGIKKTIVIVKDADRNYFVEKC